MAIPDKPLTRQEQYLDAIAKAGGGGSALPSVTSADNGKVLGVVDGEWAKDDKKFVVMCTPTAQDYSGTMDKTMGEIRAAHLAGKEIWFSIWPESVPVSVIQHSGTTMANFSAYMILTTNNVLVVLSASSADDVDYYTTTIYALTPLGS